MDIPWTEELIVRIYNEKIAWVNNSKISDQERKIEIDRLNEWKEQQLEKISS